MKEKTNHFTNFYTGKVAMLFAILPSGYWIFVHSFPVYKYKLVGIIYEILWAPMIPLLFLVPIVSLIAAIMSKFKNSFFYWLSIILTVGTFIWMYFFL